VYRCLGINVAKGNHFFILIKDIAGYLTGYDATEDAIHISSSSILSPFVFLTNLTPYIPLSFKEEGDIFL